MKATQTVYFSDREYSQTLHAFNDKLREIGLDITRLTDDRELLVRGTHDWFRMGDFIEEQCNYRDQVRRELNEFEAEQNVCHSLMVGWGEPIYRWFERQWSVKFHRNTPVYGTGSMIHHHPMKPDRIQFVGDAKDMMTGLMRPMKFIEVRLQPYMSPNGRYIDAAYVPDIGVFVLNL